MTKGNLLLFALLPATAFAQSFELADVHTSAPERYPGMRTAVRGGRFEIAQASMVDLIAAAWGVEPAKVFGGPNWLELDHFDIVAKVPPNASPQALRPMLQALLAERFGLAVHPDQRPMPAYVLSLGSGKPKMTQSDGSASPGCQRQGEASPVMCHGLTMDAFAQQLRAAAGDYIENPVVNDTKLEGPWDFTLKWTSRDRLASAGSETVTIFDAIDKQLGLKLDLKQVPSPVIVVDRVNQKPTPNAPAVATSLPPLPPPHFEVATIKPTDPQFRSVNIQTPPNGLVIQGLTINYMLQTIWFLTPERIAGAPAWLDKDRWDINAKIAASPDGPSRTDMESMLTMVRTLLEDRFRLQAHMEERVVPAYTLTAVKPKLQKADPANRTSCKEGPGADGKDPRLTFPARSRLVTCRNMIMAQFAAQLPAIANALNTLNPMIRSNILDSTGLTGAYDFTLNFTPAQLTNPNAGIPQGNGDGPSDPNGALSLAEAISQQLGLKLSFEKHPAQVLVIDHIDAKPAEN